MNNRIVVRLDSVQYALYGYRNQYGGFSHKPPKYSVRGVPYDPNAPAYPAWEGYTMQELASKLKIRDVWTPYLILKLTANCKLVYTGAKAISINKEWNRRQFKGKGK